MEAEEQKQSTTLPPPPPRSPSPSSIRIFRRAPAERPAVGRGSEEEHTLPIGTFYEQAEGAARVCVGVGLGLCLLLDRMGRRRRSREDPWRAGPGKPHRAEA